jgi:2Fe-2S ferredoxin
LKIYVYDRDGDKQTVEAVVGDSLMNPLRAADLVDATCHGSCSCATCHVYVEEPMVAQLPAKTEDEDEVIEFMEKAQDNSRLACQISLTEAMEGMTVTVAPEEGF